MDLKERLSSRCHIEDIHEILFYVQGNQERKAELYDLIFDPMPLVIERYGSVAISRPRKTNGYMINRMS